MTPDILAKSRSIYAFKQCDASLTVFSDPEINVSSAFRLNKIGFTPFQRDLEFYELVLKAFENILGKRLNAGYRINPFPNKPWFLRVCSISLLKTLWAKEKLLVTSHFSFSHMYFYQFRELSAIYIKIEIVACKFFQFGRVLSLIFGKWLKTYTLIADTCNMRGSSTLSC